MPKIKSVVLNKTVTDDGCIVEFYNPFWGRFAIDGKFDVNLPANNNMLRLMRVGDYYMVKGDISTNICEYSILRYMSKETEAARNEKRELAIPNMSVREMDNLADNILDSLNKFKKQEFVAVQKEKE